MTVPETEIKRTWPTSHIDKRGNGLVGPERTVYHFLPCTCQLMHSPPVRAPAGRTTEAPLRSPTQHLCAVQQTTRSHVQHFVCLTITFTAR